MSFFAAALGLPAGDTRLLVGVERDPDEDGGFRLYVNARYTGIHTHAKPDFDTWEARTLAAYAEGGWADHTYFDVPADALCDCRPDLTPALASRDGAAMTHHVEATAAGELAVTLQSVQR